ncbi:hypothetical protein GPECTOR_47g307 [Gonium pectorale]|uniref:F-box domain-containing protein n=1 Tax=Gonium pectorale TaxID=33097 RepID=A0A150G861_GONPE|nr:hypothetical protein GPECTOR_47g307 [Gonium pectorale]|eukprot:KXZ46032.1 hypothetical protein GPECTOR_47g307 [Gonium pectorale]
MSTCPETVPDVPTGGSCEPTAAHDALSRGDVLLEIFNRLGSLPDLGRCCAVSRAWRAAAASDLPWRALYTRAYGTPQAWEAAGSYRQQSARWAGLRHPAPSPPLPGAPAPGRALEEHDKAYGVRTLAVSYDPVTRTLLRAVRNPQLLGDCLRVAVEAVPLDPKPSECPGSTESGTPGNGSGSETDSTAAQPLWVCTLSPTGGDDDGADGGGNGGADAADALMAQQRLAGLVDLLPSVMCAAGGLLYLPAGPTGRGLAAWDLTAAPAAATAPTAAPGAPAAVPAVPTAPTPPARRPPHWLLPEAHPGRLLAVAADGWLAASGCDAGRLCFWRPRDRQRLGEASIEELTRLPVIPAFPRPAARRATERHLLRLAVCDASGLAAVLLASPLAPHVHVFRAAGPAASASAVSAAGVPAVGQRLAVLSTGGSPGDGLALLRGHLLTMSVLSSDVMGARFGGSGGSSVLVTITARVWKLPAARESGAGGGTGGAPTAAAVGSSTGRGASGDGGDADDDWGDCTRLYSSRLQLEHPRSLVLDRMRPLLAASEDLLLVTAPRGGQEAAGRQPHHCLLALEHPFGAGAGGEGGDSDGEGEGEEDGEGGEAGEERGRRRRHRRGGGSGRDGFRVVSESERLQWSEIVKDAGAVIVAVQPTPRHLALLSEDGQLRLYGLTPGAHV